MANTNPRKNYYNIESLPVMLTVADLSRLLRISRNTAYALVNEGKIPYVMVGRQIRIYRDDALAFCGKL